VSGYRTNYAGRFRVATVAIVLTWLSGCGYVGDPLPPALNIPVPVADLTAVERGNVILVAFTAPTLTTEQLTIRTRGPVELRAGPDWPGGAEAFPATLDQAGHGRAEVPAARFAGREITLGVRTASPKGRFSAWSNLVRLNVVAPLQPPASLRAAATAQGVAVQWQAVSAAGGIVYRVYRRAAAGDPVLLATVDAATYLDTTAAFGQPYSYMVQSVHKSTGIEPESDVSSAVAITPQDAFPPAVPSGLTAITGIGAVELAWDRVSDGDLKGYRVYRVNAEGGGEPRRVAEVNTPSFSDKSVESGKRYRYTVSSFDQAGNESARSAPPVEAVAP
jgi:hypothetical protein